MCFFSLEPHLLHNTTLKPNPSPPRTLLYIYIVLYIASSRLRPGFYVSIQNLSGVITNKETPISVFYGLVPTFPLFFSPHIPDPSLSLFYPLFSILNMYIFTRRPQYIYSIGSLSSSFCTQENICSNSKETYRQYMTKLHTVRNNSMGLKFASCKANSNSIQSSASANSKLSENVA